MTKGTLRCRLERVEARHGRCPIHGGDECLFFEHEEEAQSCRLCGDSITVATAFDHCTEKHPDTPHARIAAVLFGEEEDR